jgi:glycerate dehydrogenase
MASGSSSSQQLRPAAALVNCGRYNWDRLLQFSELEKHADVTVVEKDAPSDEQILASLPEGVQIVVTKEIQVGAELISKFPPSVRLLCEAGTGYNNIAMEAAQQRGITVCNVPSYSSAAVAQLGACARLRLWLSLPLRAVMQLTRLLVQ